MNNPSNPSHIELYKNVLLNKTQSGPFSRIQRLCSFEFTLLCIVTLQEECKL